MDYDVKFVEYKGGNIKVSYTVTPLNSHEEASIISRIDKPHEDFMRAWMELPEIARRLLEFPLANEDGEELGIMVTKVNFLTSKNFGRGMQLSLKEFDALARIKNLEARNEAMEKIGTNDFALAVTRAVEEEKLDAAMPVFLADMERLGIKKFPDNANKYSSKYRRIGNIDLYQYEETKEKIPKKTDGVYYEASYPRNVEFYVKETKKGKAREKSAKEIEKEKCIKEAWFKVDAMAATHYELRKAFMENFKATTKQHELVLMGAYSVAVLQGVTYMGLGSVNKEAGIDSKYFDPKRDEKAVKLAFDGYFDIQQCANVIYKLFGDSEKENYANNSRFGYPTYKINPRLEALYHWLVALGYQMSSEEKLLATGQHEVFQQIKGA